MERTSEPPPRTKPRTDQDAGKRLCLLMAAKQILLIDLHIEMERTIRTRRTSERHFAGIRGFEGTLIQDFPAMKTKKTLTESEELVKNIAKVRLTTNQNFLNFRPASRKRGRNHQVLWS
ncbi:hypothetical protein RB8672 [Rhodopirellula baltica SH 1]|uniref:Uncharacterized protein n=2 Tax=Rhodopirellula baltica TaxID=265606 RepID=Q7UMQ7_RHOBA|nr:hypothetical protein RB8672 [Rhodopirellula baltica SH 1]